MTIIFLNDGPRDLSLQQRYHRVDSEPETFTGVILRPDGRSTTETWVRTTHMRYGFARIYAHRSSEPFKSIQPPPTRPALIICDDV